MQFGFKVLAPECAVAFSSDGDDSAYVVGQNIDWCAHAAVIGYSIAVCISNYYIKRKLKHVSETF